MNNSKENEPHTSIKPFVDQFIKNLWDGYIFPLSKVVLNSPPLLDTVTGFLLLPASIIVYVGRTHVAVEYTGSEILDKNKFNDNDSKFLVQYHDFSTKDQNIFEAIIGFKYDSTLDFNFPLEGISEDMLFPTNKGWDELIKLGWLVSAQNSMMSFNTPPPKPEIGKFSRIINGLFFDANESGLTTRHIKWIDFFPLSFDGSDDEVDKISMSIPFTEEMVLHDANYRYPMPKDYKYKQLPKINRFIELWGNSQSSEPDITSFLSKEEHEFILSMRFGAIGVHSELTCEWQSDDSKENIRPDFFIVNSNGYADIVEFKLPTINKNVVVGSNNRESFGAWLQSYISQTRVYASFFDDPNNRRWFENKYGFKVHKPRRWLIVGRRSDFDSEVWREIAHDYKDLEIITFDDLIDGVVAQFYKK